MKEQLIKNAEKRRKGKQVYKEVQRQEAKKSGIK